MNEQLVFEFVQTIVVPLYRMTWREGETIRVVTVPEHSVRLVKQEELAS